jgi:hypothetical protein
MTQLELSDLYQPLFPLTSFNSAMLSASFEIAKHYITSLLSVTTDYIDHPHYMLFKYHMLFTVQQYAFIIFIFWCTIAFIVWSLIASHQVLDKKIKKVFHCPYSNIHKLIELLESFTFHWCKSWHSLTKWSGAELSTHASTYLSSPK